MAIHVVKVPDIGEGIAEVELVVLDAMLPGRDGWEILHLVRRARNDELYLQNGYTVMVIWGCTAVKELYLFLLIMIFYCGPFWAKVWYTPICLAVLYLYNLLRIGLIPWFAGNGYYSFEFWHELFRLSYYGLLFLLWIGWNEHFVTKQFVRIRLKRMFKGTKVIHRFRRRWW